MRKITVVLWVAVIFFVVSATLFFLDRNLAGFAIIGTGQKGTTAINSFVLVNGNTGAEIQLIDSGSILDLATIPSNIQVKVNAIPSIVYKVLFTYDGSSVTDSRSPYMVSLGTLVAGNHVLRATPYSGKKGSTSGNYSQISFSVIDTRTVAVTPPSVSVVSPQENSTISSPITIEASATSSVGISKVEFYVDDLLIGTDTTAPFAYQWSPSSVNVGAHKIKAQAVDRNGNSNSDAKNIHVAAALPVSTTNVLQFTLFADGTQSTLYGTSTIANKQTLSPNIFLLGGIASSPTSKVVDTAHMTISWKYTWGSYDLKIIPGINQVLFNVTINNTSPSTVIEGASLHLGSFVMPVSNAANGDGPIEGYSVAGPAYATYFWNGGNVSLVNEDPLTNIALIQSHDATAGTCMECRGLSFKNFNYDTNQGRPAFVTVMNPGQVKTMTVSLRADSGFSDIYPKYSSAYPIRVPWQNRNPITMVFNKYSSTTDGTAWVDVNAAISAARAQNAQGVIVWDIEGYRILKNQTTGQPILDYKGDTIGDSYVGDPRLLAQLNPSVNAGADAWFAAIRAAGLTPGITLRWGIANIRAGNKENYTDQLFPSTAELTKDIIDSANYSRNRWGVKIFYVDSNDAYDTAVWDNVTAALPDCLFIPELSVKGGFTRFTLPYKEVRDGGDVYLFNTYLPNAQLIWPTAGVAIQMRDAGSVDINNAAFKANVSAAIRSGSLILGGDATWVKSVYHNAGIAGF